MMRCNRSTGTEAAAAAAAGRAACAGPAAAEEEKALQPAVQLAAAPLAAGMALAALCAFCRHAHSRPVAASVRARPIKLQGAGLANPARGIMLALAQRFGEPREG